MSHTLRFALFFALALGALAISASSHKSVGFDDPPPICFPVACPDPTTGGGGGH